MKILEVIMIKSKYNSNSTKKD